MHTVYKVFKLNSINQRNAAQVFVPVLVASSYNGNLLQPTHKRFYSAYLQHNFVFVEIFQSYLRTIRNFFLLITSHHNV